MAPALTFDAVEVTYTVRGVARPVLRGLSFTIARGESYGLVGESGCGKSTVAYAAVRHLDANGAVSSGSIEIAGKDLLAMSKEELRRMRAETVSMVHQNPMSSLNPTLTVGRQMVQTFRITGMGRAEANQRSLEMLEKVRISDPSSVMKRYPHQLSGGMAQRVVIAMALAKNPALLVLDEPTTGLDATVEREILALIAELHDDFGTSVLFISHNLELVAQTCDRVGVLYAGKLVEQGSVTDVLRHPRHPYTGGLVRCLPQPGSSKGTVLPTIPGLLPQLGAPLPACVFADRCAMAEDICRGDEPPVVELTATHHVQCHFPDQTLTPSAVDPVGTRCPVAAGDVVLSATLSKTYSQRGHSVRALSEVSIQLRAGETLGLVGESGSGKTTLAKVLVGLETAEPGSSIELNGKQIPLPLGKRRQEDVRSMQIVFQNPQSALNRRFTVRRIIGRAIHKLQSGSIALLTPHHHASNGGKNDAPGGTATVATLARDVQLDERLLDTRPAQLSGGLKQRVVVATAFAGNPAVVVCDEPTSALDVSVRAAILNLLTRLQRERHVSYLFISHDLGVVRYVSDRIGVLYLGQLVELGTTDEIFGGPNHPYTEVLLSGVARELGARAEPIRLAGEMPSRLAAPSGCVFHSRCPRVIDDRCATVEPPLRRLSENHTIRCHHSFDLLPPMQVASPSRHATTTRERTPL